jgi:transcriptional regulator with XRE-family HTH domain
MRHSSQKHNVARLRVFLGEKQEQFAVLIGCSVHTLQSIETGRLKLSEEVARRISVATGVHLRWVLENDLEAEIVGSRGHPFTKSDFECVQANKKIGSSEFMRFMVADYGASFYGQIRALLSSAVKRELAKFLEDCRREFGHDKKLMPGEEQFGLRADDSPYLKFGQIEAGIKLFREYEYDRKKSILRALVPETGRKKQTRKKKGTATARKESAVDVAVPKTGAR